MKRIAIAAAALTAALALPAGASARGAATHRESARSGAVQATLSYQGAGMRFGHEWLSIRRGGRLLYRRPVVAARCGAACIPAAVVSAGTPSLRVVRLQAGHEPQVVLQVFSGGAHCCTVVQVFRFDAHRDTYVRAQHDFGDPGVTLRDLDHNGRLEFVSADDGFAGRFTDDVHSGLPVLVMSFADGQFFPITSAYPGLIKADATRWLQAYRSSGLADRDSVGLIAAWAADENELGAMDSADVFLHAEARAGRLVSSLYGPRMSGERFISALNPYLFKQGYVPMCGGA